MQCTVIESNIQSCAVLYSDRLLQYIILLYNNVNYLVEPSPPPARQMAGWEVAGRVFSVFGLYCVCVSVYQVFLCITFLLIHVAMSIIGCPTTTIGMYGYVWVYKGIYDYVWVCIVMCG